MMPATMDSTYRRLSMRGAREAQLFSLILFPSSMRAIPPLIMAETMGLAMYLILPASEITGVTMRSSGLVSMVA